METIRIRELKIAIPNISHRRAAALERHLNKIMIELAVRTLQLALSPELDGIEFDNPVVPPGVTNVSDE